MRRLLTRLLLLITGTTHAADIPFTLDKPGNVAAAVQSAEPRGFERRGFYLHGSWVMEHPFAVRS